MAKVRRKTKVKSVHYYECTNCGAANADKTCPHCDGDGVRRKATKL